MRRRTFLTYCLRVITVRDTDCGEAHKYTFTGYMSHAGAVRLLRAHRWRRTAVESVRSETEGGRMTDQDARPNAAAAGTFSLGGDLLVNRLGFGAMRLTGRGILGEPEDPDEARRVLRRAVELGVERIDLYQLHRPDPKIAFEDSVWVLAQLRDEGKIRHVGLSNVGVRELEIALDIVPVASVQNRYNLSDRSSEAVLQACEREEVGFIPWYPLATGRLARPRGPLDEVAERHDVTPSQVALAWLLGHSPAMLPIPGTSSVAHLEENVAAATLELTDEEMAMLERS